MKFDKNKIDQLNDLALFIYLVLSIIFLFAMSGNTVDNNDKPASNTEFTTTNQ